MRKYLLHCVFWVVFFLMWSRFVYFYVSNLYNRLYFSTLDVSLVIVAFYIIYFYLVPDFIRHKNIGKLIGLSAGLVILLAFSDSWIMGVLLHHMVVPISFNFSWNYTDLQYNRFFIALLGVFAGCFVRLAIDRVEVERKMEVMKKEKTLAELTYLKAQINPHFLFNSLNSLYTQMDLDPGDAKGTLSALADLLRYQLYECNHEVIAVAKELAYLKNYINLQKIRTDNCNINLVIGEQQSALYIAPLLLIPFVENAFKYVSDHEEKSNFIKVEVGFQDKQLQFFCSNTVNLDTGNLTPAEDKGIGLINVRKRLDLIYPGRYSLLIDSEGEVYEVTLIIDLK